jgi:IS30 family transposase
MARPRQVLDEARAEQLAQEGNTDAEIARQLGVSPKTIQRRKQDSDRFDLALKRGREAAHSVVSNALYRQAKKGNVAAIVWYEKTRRGFRDSQDITSNGETLKVYQGFDPEAV